MALLVCIGTTTACLVRTRTEPLQPSVLRTATLEELTAKLRAFGAIQTMKSTVDMRLSVEMDSDEADKRKIREFTEVRGFILIRRPASIRTIAELPVVKTRAFDMVCDGKSFTVYIPPKHRFLIGSATMNTHSKRRIERVRPQHILEALLIDPPRENEPYEILENFADAGRAFQIVHLLRKGKDGKLRLSRKLWFDRASFDIFRQQVFDDDADMVTDAYYGEWSLDGSIPFPGTIFLSRPKDGYELQVRIVKPGLNEPIPDDRFVLKPPKGVHIERIGEDTEEEAAEASAHD